MKKLFLLSVLLIFMFTSITYSSEYNSDTIDQAKIDELTSDLLVYNDDFDGDSTYYSKFTHEDYNGSPTPSLNYNNIFYYEPFEIRLYRNSEGFRLVFVFSYRGKQWLFFELVRIKVDDEIYDFDLSSFKIHRKVLDDGKVIEYAAIHPNSDLIEMFRKAYQSKNLTIRFVGKDNTFTYEAPEETLNAIEEIITIYDQVK